MATTTTGELARIQAWQQWRSLKPGRKIPSGALADPTSWPPRKRESTGGKAGDSWVVSDEESTYRRKPSASSGNVRSFIQRELAKGTDPLEANKKLAATYFGQDTNAAAAAVRKERERGRPGGGPAFGQGFGAYGGGDPQPPSDVPRPPAVIPPDIFPGGPGGFSGEGSSAGGDTALTDREDREALLEAKRLAAAAAAAAAGSDDGGTFVPEEEEPWWQPVPDPGDDGSSSNSGSAGNTMWNSGLSKELEGMLNQSFYSEQDKTLGGRKNLFNNWLANQGWARDINPYARGGLSKRFDPLRAKYMLSRFRDQGSHTDFRSFIDQMSPEQFMSKGGNSIEDMLKSLQHQGRFPGKGQSFGEFISSMEPGAQRSFREGFLDDPSVYGNVIKQGLTGGLSGIGQRYANQGVDREMSAWMDERPSAHPLRGFIDQDFKWF